MKALTLADLVGIDQYEALRDDYRAKVVAHKRPRRLPVGPNVTLIFENRETMRFQIQEMMRAERTREAQKIQIELDTYNELVPGDGELSATLMVEITELAEIRPELEKLIGLDEHVTLWVGEHRIPADFDPKQIEEDRLSAVQYIKFVLPEAAHGAFRDLSIPVAVEIDQPNYRQRAELPRELRHSLLEDLAGGVAALLDVPSGSGVEASSQSVLYEGDGVRVRRPFHPAGPGHLVIEATGDESDWLAVSDARWSELHTLLRRYAGTIREEHGACRCVTDLHAGPRFHLYAPR